MDRNKMIADGLMEWPRSRGRKEYVKFLRGGKITQKQAIWAYCYRCSSAYDTGKLCTVTDCPLLLFQPYRDRAKNRGVNRAEESVSDKG